MSIVMDTTTEFKTNDEVRIPKRRCLITILIAVALRGILVGVLPEDSGFLFFSNIALNLIAVVTVIIWCQIDSEQWDFTISKRLSLMLFLLLVIAFPYYISMTRKGTACLKALGLAALFVYLNLTVFTVTLMIGSLIYEVIHA